MTEQLAVLPYRMTSEAARIVRAPISLADVRALADGGFGDMVKAAVDIDRGIMALAGELHSDEAALFLEAGSKPSDVWGINIDPDEPRDEWIEFDAMINVRPGQGNVRAVWRTPRLETASPW